MPRSPNRSLPPAVTADPRWSAVASRDPGADGRFFYAVATTGIYCRPSCPSRRPRPEHVSFHRSAAEARAAGFRPCQRCHPDDGATGHETQAEVIASVCRQIDRAVAEALPAPTLAQLARPAGLSPFQLHRLFKAATGLTPRTYAAAQRGQRMRSRLHAGRPVTEALHEVGYGSSSRFYESSDELLGMRPTDFRSGGRGTEIRFALGECSLGSILVAAGDRGLCAILLGDDPEPLLRDLERRFPRARLIGGDADFERVVAQVVGFVDDPAQGLALPLDLRGTLFQQRVWQALRQVLPGQTVSYTDLARRIGAPAAVRAVAQACAANPLAVAIPCHRVVRKDGDLSGYRWGVERKRRLLQRESGKA